MQALPQGATSAMKTAIMNQLLAVGVIPIVRVNDADLALRIADALLEGGAGTIEITATVPGAPRVIESLTKRFPDLLVGAGTILEETDARKAIDAGARYLVTVAMLPAVIKTAHRYGLPALPGVFTPTEAVAALEAGADALKLFPASAVGPAYLKALRAPLPQAVWCPVGGVELENLGQWVTAGASLVGVGSPLLQDVARTRDFAALARRMRAWVDEWRRVQAERSA